MKKFKLMALSCLAVFGLAACEAPEFLTKIIPSLKKEATVTSVAVSGAPASVTDETAPFQLVADVVVENDASKEVTWSTSNASVATVSESGLVTPVGAGSVTITATSVADTSKSGSVTFSVSVKPAVVSVTIQNAPTKLNLLSKNVTLSANVVVKGTIANGVKWTSSDESVATINQQTGAVTIKGEGTVTFTATALADATKSDSVTVVIVDEGFAPEFLEYGYSYSKGFPVDVIKQFLGAGDYEIVSPDSLPGGCYYCVYPEDEEGPACIQVILDGVVYEDYARDLMYAGFERVYETYEGYEAVDPSKIYTVSMMSDFDGDAFEDIAPTYICFYKSADVWEGDTLTTDTEWSLSHISEDSEDYVETITQYLANIPFIAMGAQYEINYVDNSLLRGLAEALGGDPSDYPDEFYICDYTLRDNAFDEYEDILVAQGFVAYSDEYGVYYVKDSGIDEFIIYTGFGEGGNTIYFEKTFAILDAWPEEAVASFVLDQIQSKYSVPTYVGDDDALYAMEIVSEEISETEAMQVAEIQVSASTKIKFDAYMEELTTAGFKVEYTAGTDESYPSFEATKGKIILEGVFSENYIESSKTYDPENGAVQFYLYGDSEGHEEPGIYSPESMKVVLKDGEFVLPLEVVELESPVLSATSSEEGVATVEVIADGVKVTPVAAGETTITVSVSETEYQTVTVLTVSEKTLFAEEMEKVNEAFLNLGAEVALELPEVSCTQIVGEFNEEKGSYRIMMETTVDPVDYADILEATGFEISIDEFGYPVAKKDDYVVEPWDYEGYFILDISYKSQEESDGVTFNYSELTDTKATIGDYTVDCHKTGGEAASVIFNNEELRMYAGNEMVISSSGEPITSIDFYSCDCTSKVGATFAASTGTLTKTDYGYHWEGNATEIKFTCTKVDDNHKQTHFFSIEVNGGGSGGGGGGSSIDVETALEDIEEITVDIAAAYLGKSASQIKVGYEDEDDVDVYVWDYSFYGFICSDFTVEPTGNETSDLSKMKAALPNGATLDSYNTYEEDDYHDIWYTYGDYSIGIYYYDGDASFAVVPTEMLDIYFEMMYGE